MFVDFSLTRYINEVGHQNETLWKSIIYEFCCNYFRYLCSKLIVCVVKGSTFSKFYRYLILAFLLSSLPQQSLNQVLVAATAKAVYV